MDKDENDICNICKRTFKNGRARRIHELRSHKDQDANSAVEKDLPVVKTNVAKLARLEILESRLTVRQQAYAMTSIKKWIAKQRMCVIYWHVRAVMINMLVKQNDS